VPPGAEPLPAAHDAGTARAPLPLSPCAGGEKEVRSLLAARLDEHSPSNLLFCIVKTRPLAREALYEMAECRVLARHPTLWRADTPQQAAASAQQLPAAPALSLHLAPLEILRLIASHCSSARDLLSFSAVCKTTRCGSVCC
jgi:hypothetical protein